MTVVRVSFQGGGAFFAMMLPIAHAFREVENSGALKIESVAGTSAGSICAALLASGCDFDEIRSYCLGKPEGSIRTNLKIEIRKISGRYYDGISKFGYFNTIRELIYGKDLIDRNELSNFIKLLINKGNSNISFDEISSLDIEKFHFNDNVSNLFITRSNLKPDYLEIPLNGSAIDLIVDSCSIPFALKNYKSIRSNSFIDGGLCENLPISCFNEDDNVPLFAVSISEDEDFDFSNIGLLDYLLKIFSMTIGHNVFKSKDSIGESFCYEEVSDFKFHQIRKAVDWYLHEDNYNTLKNKYVSKLKGYAEYYRLSRSGQFFSVGKNTIKNRDEDMKAIISKIFEPNDWEILPATLVVTAHSANRYADSSSNLTDIILNIGRVRVLRGGALAYKAFVRLAQNRMHPTSWSVHNITQNRAVPFRIVHYQDPEDGRENVDPCFILFDFPERDVCAEDVLEIRSFFPSLDSQNMSGLLSEQATDFATLSNWHQQDVELQFVLKYPSSLGNVSANLRDGSLLDFEMMDQAALNEYSSINDVEISAI